ncbi:hypothetical protein [Microvirga rosea]|uniref:hypothetical protein n=1 Tax=Microvirga rosea TaxID=2715425 RepID=UPI001D0A3792|nr:hypothetical protein [Microvirga rosea]MCB8819379.1 hypothetical protein [Microvirga rosea]
MKKTILTSITLCTLLSLSAAAMAHGFEEQDVLPDKTHILRYYYNCKGRVAPLNVKADRGFVRTEKSTRFICGNPDQPVIQITYLSPEGFRGADTVRYYLQGRLDQIDRVNVGSKRTARLVGSEETLQVTSDQERIVYRIFNCNGKIADPSVTVQRGFVTVRDGTTEACGRYNQPSRNVVYRSASNFVGADRIVIKTDFAPPVTLPVEVSGGSPATSEGKDTVARRAPEPSAPVSQPENVPEERSLPATSGDQRWIVFASRQSFEDAKKFAKGLSADIKDVRVVRAQNGWFAIVAGPLEQQIALKTLKSLKDNYTIPQDSKLTKGETYTGLVWNGPNFLEASLAYSGNPTKLVWRDLEIKVDSVQGSDADSKTPVAYGSINGQRVFTIKLDQVEVAEPKAQLRLLWLDRTSPYPQVMFTSYWGGAHCCTVTAFANARDKKDWQVTHVDPLDGDGFAVEDALDQGTPVIIGWDNRFLYRFGSYAGSISPMQIQEFRGGKLQDVTRDPRYAFLLRRQLGDIEKDLDWSDPDFERNSYLAGWVAVKALLGEEDVAWAEMLKRYDRSSTNGLEGCRIELRNGASCPPDKVLKQTYPDALRDFLSKAGYLTKVDASPARVPSDERTWEYLKEGQTVVFGVPESDSVTARLTCVDKGQAQIEMEYSTEAKEKYRDGQPLKLKVDKAGSILEIEGQLKKHTFGDEFMGWNFDAKIPASHSLFEFMKVGGTLKIGAEPPYELPLAGAGRAVEEWQFACQRK